MSGNKFIKPIVIIAVVVSLTAMGGVMYYNNKSIKAASDTTQELKTLTATKGDIRIAISADGKSSFLTTNVNFKNSGTISEILVKEGQNINPGDVLAKLNVENLQHLVEQAQSNYNSAVARLNKLKSSPSSTELASKQIAVDNAKSALSIAQEIFDFKEQQYNEGKLSEGEYLSEKSKLEAAKAQLKNAESQLSIIKQVDSNDIKVAQEAVNQAKAALDIAKNNLESIILKAPVGGKVLSINGKIGENSVSASSGQGSSAFMVLADANKVYVEANILEDDIGKIQLDQSVEISFNAIAQENFIGKVSSISSNATIDQSGITSYKVIVAMDNKDERIKPGMTSSLSFIFEKADGVITIPNEAVKRLDGSAAVEVQNSDGNTEIKKIKTGLTDGVKVEVKEGLNESEKIIIRKAVTK